MANLTARTVAAACGGAAVFALALSGIGGVPAPRTNMTDPVTTVEPTPTSPDDVCCDTPQPQASGWECKIGLNCGPINPRRTWPPP
ncbi:hypothetical protein, partial [Mycobacterium colombiense]|uniref:hypothetical protein n=1 Tax=Mycobacterium colombiense TaxID=339268 RepID=UPI0039E96378